MPELPRLPRLPKPPKISKALSRFNPVQGIGEVLKDGVEGMQTLISDLDDAVRQIDSSFRGAAPTGPPEETAPAVIGITGEETLRYQIDLLLDDLQHLETEHLPNQGRIGGKPCDCVAKAGRDLRRHARETIPIASRQGRDPRIFSQMAAFAEHLVEIGGLDAVVSGKYDEHYLELAGVASNLRKEMDLLMAELRPKSYKEECEECPSVLELKTFLEERRRKATE